MTDIATIQATTRERAGKGTARAARRDGQVPGVVYGDKKEPLLVILDSKMLDREIGRSGFFSKQFDLDVGGQKHRVMARDVQLHPVTDRPLHVDFLRVGADTRLRLNISVIFKNEALSPGLKRGGVLNVVRHEIEMECAVTAVPHAIEIDLSGLDIGDSVHVSHIKLPESARLIIADRDFTIATIAPPTVTPTEEEEAATEAEEEAAATEAEEEADAKEKGES